MEKNIDSFSIFYDHFCCQNDLKSTKLSQGKKYDCSFRLNSQIQSICKCTVKMWHMWGVNARSDADE